MYYYDRKLGRVLIYDRDELVLIIGNDGNLYYKLTNVGETYDLEEWTATRVVNGFLNGDFGLKLMFDDLFGAS